MADIVLLSTADWNHPLWTNKQHVALALVELGYRVLYVDSLGLRAPQPTGRDLRRIARRLVRGFMPPRQIQPGLWVWSPLVWPGGFAGPSLWINHWILSWGLRLSLSWIGFNHPWLWTYNPLSAKLLKLSRYPLIVYHAVDAVQEQPCMPRALIDEEEEKLCSQADYVFVTSPNIESRLRRFSRRIRFDPNVADYRHFSSCLDLNPARIPSDLAIIPEPRIGFVGAISNYKLDFGLISAVATANPQWQFVFLGPTGEGEPFTNTELLKQQPNIHLLGRRSYEALPFYCAGFACGWLPLRINPYTQSMFPMKFFEYLSAGLPVVATNINSLLRYGDVAFLVSPNPHDFADALNAAINGAGPDLETRLAVAKQHTYLGRTQSMLTALAEEVD